MRPLVTPVFRGGLLSKPLDFEGMSAFPVGSPGEGRLRYNETLNVLEVSLGGAPYAELLTSTGPSIVTLQNAYTGGATILTTTANGPVALFGNQANNDSVLTVAKNPLGAQSGEGISVTMGANTTGNGITVVQNGIGLAASFSGGDVLITGSARVQTDVQLLKQAADPAFAANNGIVYTKLVGGAVELFYEDSTGAVTQITGNGTGLQGAYNAGATITTSLVQGPVTITNPAATPQTAFVVSQATAGQFAIDATGDCRVAGKLTVTGVIDPTQVLLTGADKRFGATDAGTVYLAPFANSTTGVQVRRADNVTAVVTVDTTNSRVGIGTSAPTQQLEVAGNTKLDSNLSVGGAVPFFNANAVGTSFTAAAFYQGGGANLDKLLLWNPTDVRFELGDFDTVGGTTAPAGALTTLRDLRLADLSLAGTAITADGLLTVTATAAPLTLVATGANDVAVETNGLIRWDVTLDGAQESIGIPTISQPAVSAAGDGRLYYDSTLNEYLVSLSGAAYTPLVTASSLSLQSSYDGGQTITEAAVGGSITQTPVSITNSVATGTDVLQLVKSPAGAQSGNGLTVTMGANATGIGVSVLNSGTGPAAVFSGTTTAAASVYVGNGTSSAAPVAGSVLGTAASAAATAGGAITLQAGAGNTSGSGGATNVTGGAGGATGAGASVVLTGGAGGSSSGNAGGVTISGGTPVSGAGGSITVTATAGVGTNKAGGSVTETAGNATGTAAAGSVTVTAGQSVTGAAGTISLTGGAGGSTSGTGGAASLTGGAGTAGNSAGGSSSLVGGAGQGSASGGQALVTGGAGGATGNGGGATLQGGSGGATSGNGGDATVAGGTVTLGTAGSVVFDTAGTERNRVTSDGAFQFTGLAAAPTNAPASDSRLYWDSTRVRQRISENGLAYQDFFYWVKVTKTFSDFAVAAMTNSITGYTLQSGGVIHAVKIKQSTSFTGGGIVKYTIEVGIGGNTNKYANAFNVFQAVGNTVQQLSTTVGIESTGSSTPILFTAKANGANLNAATQGSVDIFILVSDTGF